MESQSERQSCSSRQTWCSFHRMGIFISLIGLAVTLAIYSLYWIKNVSTLVRWNANRDSVLRQSNLTLTQKHFIVQPTNWDAQQALLPNLTSLAWPPDAVASLPAGSKDKLGQFIPLPPLFKPVMSQVQRNLYGQLLSKFSEIMFANSLGDRFTLYGGTLLGSLRHHDFIPWDDDIDVLVDIGVRDRVRVLLSQHKPLYRLYPTSERDKFFAQKIKSGEENLDVNRSRPVRQWAWPFLDISYFDRNESHIWDISKAFGYSYSWPINIFFPLIFRPFGRKWFPCPKKSVRFSELTYSSHSKCYIPGYSHVFEYGTPSGSIKCRQLFKEYAFVRKGHCQSTASSDELLSTPMLMCREDLVQHDSNDNPVSFHQLTLTVHSDERDFIGWNV